MKTNNYDKKLIGKVGEEIVCIYLEKKGYRVLERNYLKKWGEIDIVAKKGRVIHFIEVKSVSVVQVIHETYRAEDNIHPKKIQRLNRAIYSYLLDTGCEDAEWQIDAAIVRLDAFSKKARISIIENVF